ncbi:hypothetical protein [Chryseobacterium populi]|uniref:Uncharacterized protein n=1 Tax=Chryseobacterium populi TaxID=1144316 RepID=J2JVD7_9FLAO|nr:hypothetical protein [Chryseobacterium populi]EJL71840.1 hypothetical protein PMI13_02177 [Chryseobacterium populi]
METIIISERKKSVITDAVLMVIFCIVPLFFFIKWWFAVREDHIFIVFLILLTLVFPMVMVSGYLWDIKKKIILSKAGMKIRYGRNIVDILHGEGTFNILPDLDVSWNKISGFFIDRCERKEPTEGGGYSTVTKYSLLIKIRDREKALYNFKETGENYYSVGLGKFSESPGEILEICERFQQNINERNNS